MFLNDILKAKKKKTSEAASVKPRSKPVLVKEEKPQSGNSYPILMSPHVTEKATTALENNSYIFKVYPKVNKTEVKKAIQNLYKVTVIGVRIINIAAKKRRLGKSSGWKHGYKKAIVKIRKDQKIDLTIV